MRDKFLSRRGFLLANRGQSTQLASGLPQMAPSGGRSNFRFGSP
jgi:hypothetical protein